MKPLVVSTAGIILIIAGFMLFNKPIPQQTTNTQTSSPSPIPIKSGPTIQNEKVDIQAKFTIITGNITRSFTSEKYHNKSSDVFIESKDPTIVYVKKTKITWDNFFNTLPMKLSKSCLITGDGETFCDGKDGSLKFYLNSVEDKNLLDKEIKQGDIVLIKFTF